MKENLNDRVQQILKMRTGKQKALMILAAAVMLVIFLTFWQLKITGITMTDTDSSGEIHFTGLNSGTYVLKETKAPDEYSQDSLLNIKLVLSWTENLKTGTTSILMMLTMSIGNIAFAETSADGSITITGTKDGAAYDLYRIFNLTMGGDDKVAYTVNSEWKAFFATDTGKTYLVDTNSGDLNRITVDGAVKYINITSSNVAAFAEDALSYAGSKTPVKSVKGDGSDVTVSGLELGYYLVYPEGAADILDGNGSICSLTSTVPNAAVNIKAGYPVITKTVDDATVEYGQVITYTVTGKVPDTKGYSTYKYEVSDTMSEGLTFNGLDTINVKIDGEAAAAADVTTALNNNGFVLNIDVMKYQDKLGKDIVITYTATVNEKAVIGAAGNDNEAVLKYSNDPKNTDSYTTNPPVEVPVYTCAVAVNKYDGNDDTKKLAGAKFILLQRDASGAAGYYVLENGKVSWTADKDSATVMTTDSNGYTDFKGVQDGEYELEEIAAPDGYNLLTETAKITVNHADQTAEVFQKADVPNYTGTQLPGTGGMGTKLFLLAGSVLMISAGVLLIARRRMHISENR